jgi:hypothetical protein
MLSTMLALSLSHVKTRIPFPSMNSVDTGAHALCDLNVQIRVLSLKTTSFFGKD